VEREDRPGEGVDRGFVCGPRMIAREDALHEGSIDSATVLRLEFGELLLPLGERRAAFARPDEGIQREARDSLRMMLREKGGFQGTRRYAVDQELSGPRFLQNEF